MWRIAGTIAAAVMATSCAHVGDSWIFGSMASAAHDQIMLVRESPPSFGYQRLVSQGGIYQDLGYFIKLHGPPDFLAETGNRERHYFILYYLGKRQAYACRTRPGMKQAVEFAGPYPVTDREYRMLDAFRKDPTRKPPKF